METAAEIPLAPLTTLRLGGAARVLVEATTEAELVAAAGSDALVLGGGSNVVIADAGYPGTVVRIALRGIERDGARLTVAAGEPWDDLVALTVAEGLAGIEALSGIPGLTGATPIQNVGAYGQDVAETVTGIRAYDRDLREVIEMSAEQLGFGYRTSALKGDTRYVVLAVTFALRESDMGGPIRYAELARRLDVPVGGSAPLAEIRAAVLELRRGKGMVIDPEDPDSVSAGSFFTNPIVGPSVLDTFEEPPPHWPEPDGRVKLSAAWLIERSGFHKGYERGRVGISTKHTLALVNRGGATTADLLRVAREIAAGVDEAFGVRLEPEPIFVGHAWDGDARPPGT